MTSTTATATVQIAGVWIHPMTSTTATATVQIAGVWIHPMTSTATVDTGMVWAHTMPAGRARD